MGEGLQRADTAVHEWIGVAVLAGSGLAQAQSEGGPAPLKKFRVLLPFKVGITFFPISVADELGYLKSEGINLDLQVANGSSAVVQGSIPTECCEPDSTEVKSHLQGSETNASELCQNFRFELDLNDRHACAIEGSCVLASVLCLAARRAIASNSGPPSAALLTSSRRSDHEG
jgi:hypothetical protein